jgi:serine/threonine-protein kinase
MKINNYNIIKIIKQKSDTKITYLAERVGDKLPVLIKKFDCNNQYAYIGFLREININFKHKNINKLIDNFKLDNYCFVVREFICGTNLQKAFEKHKFKRKIKNNLLRNFALQILYGLEVLHNNNIIHRDIRPANIMLEFDNDINDAKAVICDFEMAKLPSLNKIDNFSFFSFFFSPPEQVLHLDDLVNFSSDFYALGITLWCLFTSKIPFAHSIPEIIANLQITYPLQYDKKIPLQFWKIIQKATFKYSLKKPPAKYRKDELIKLIRQAQKLRYQTAAEMIEDIKNIEI